MMAKTALLGLAGLAIAWTQPAWALDVEFTEFTLANGMQVVIIPDHRAPVVTHSVWYKVGSADEVKGKSGLAHFLEHLMFKGTHKHPEGAFDRLLELNGAHGNAFTTQDYTAYYQRISSDRLNLVMELESDRMQNLVLNDVAVTAERKVVQEERRQRTENDPAAMFAEQIEAKMFTAHPYGRPVVGWMHEVERLTLDDAMAFYRAHYTPANAILVVSGDVAPATAKSLAEKYYGSLKNAAQISGRKREAEPLATAARRLTMVNAQARYPYVSRYYLAPSRKQAGLKQAAALQFAANILGSGTQARLHASLVLDQKLAIDTGAGYTGSQLDSGELALYAVPAPGVDVAVLEKAMDDVLDHVLHDGVTQKELDRVRNQLRDAQIYALDDAMALLQYAGVAVATGLSVQEAFSTAEWVGITKEDVTEALRNVLNPNASVTGVLTKG